MFLSFIQTTKRNKNNNNKNVLLDHQVYMVCVLYIWFYIEKLWKSSGNNVDDQTPDEDYDYVMYG